MNGENNVVTRCNGGSDRDRLISIEKLIYKQKATTTNQDKKEKRNRRNEFMHMKSVGRPIDDNSELIETNEMMTDGFKRKR